MSITRFLEVTGALRSGGREAWFQLPATGLAARSLRFGNHALVVSALPVSRGGRADTMQILPLGDLRRLSQEPPGRPGAQSSAAGRMAALISKSKLFSLLM